MVQRYLGGFHYEGASTYTVDDIMLAFQVSEDDLITDDQVVFAVVDEQSDEYNGSAWIVFHHNGQLYEVHGSHCSCYGFEAQWIPSGTSEKFVLSQIEQGWMEYSGYRDDLKRAFEAYVLRDVVREVTERTRGFFFTDPEGGQA
jgi:hypothetical protein